MDKAKQPQNIPVPECAVKYRLELDCFPLFIQQGLLNDAIDYCLFDDYLGYFFFTREFDGKM